MSAWMNNNNNIEGSIALAVAAAAAEVTTLSEYEYLPELDLHFDRTSGYFFKKGLHDYHHAGSHYTYRFDEGTSTWQCFYEPDWDQTVGCSSSLDAYVLLLDILQQLQHDEDERETPDDVEADGSSTEECYPCIRAVALESDSLPYGHLSVVTIDGATISFAEETEETDAGLVIVGESSDKALCSIRFDAETKRFQLEKMLTEDGEEEGEVVASSSLTISLNGNIVETDSTTLSHQDRLSVDAGDAGYIVLSLHIHKGTNTCAGCEPGLLLANWRGGGYDSNVTVQSTFSTRGELERSRRRELKQLKKKYALSRVDYVQDGAPRKASHNYTDRAHIRRQTAGSDLPLSAAEAISARSAASTSKAMDEGNRGYRLLQKMGWKEGSGVGRREDGIKEPICPVGHMDSSGLGSNSSIRVAVGDANEAQKRLKWTKAAQRFARLEQSAIFEGAFDDDGL